jgi:hypothetical protein
VGKNAVTTIVVDTSGGDVRDAVVRLTRGTVLTLDLELNGLDRVIDLRDAAGHQIQLDRGTSRSSTRLQVMVAPGTYTLAICDGARVVYSRQISVGSTPVRVRVLG